MTSPDTGRAGEVRAVPTNGIGKRTTAHLNLTVTLADTSWPGWDHPTRKGAPEKIEGKTYLRTYERQPKIRFAGAE